MPATSEEAKAQAESINQEQLFHDLEQRFISLKKDYSLKEAELESLTKEHEETQRETTTIRLQLKTKTEGYDKAMEDMTGLKSDVDQMRAVHESLEQLSDRRLREIDELQATIKEQSQQLIDIQKKESKAMVQYAELETTVSPLRFDIDRLQKEKEILQKHTDWAEKQVAEKTEQLREARQKANSSVFEAESKVKELQDEVESLKNSLASAKKSNAQWERSLQLEKDRCKEIETKLVVQEEQSGKELSAQKRLANLYKESADEANAKVNQLQSQVDSLREIVDGAEKARAEEIEKLKQETTEVFKQQAEASEEKMKELQEALKEANKVAEAAASSGSFGQKSVAAICAVSDTAVSQMLSSEGITMKEMYDRVVESEKQLREERSQKQKLELYMSQIIKEVQEKAPMITSQRMDYQRALASHDQLSERLDVAMQELSKAKKNEATATKNQKAIEEENKVLQKQTEDLARQVQALLRIQAQSKNAPTSTSRELQITLTASDTISENLVVFRNIEELQARNQDLLKVVRKLSEEKEVLALPASTNSSNQLTNFNSEDQLSLNGAMRELEELRLEHDRQSQMIQAIIHQRDMYRVLLAQSDSKFIESQEESAASPANFSMTPKSSESKKTNRRSSMDVTESRMLRELQMEYEDYKKEKRLTEQALQDAVEKSRADASQAKLTAAQAEVDTRFVREQYQNLLDSKKAADDEVVRYRAKNSELQTMLLTHQKSIADSEIAIDTAQQKIQQLEIDLHNALSEKELLVANEERLASVNTKLRLDSMNQLKLMDSIQRIEAGIESKSEQEKKRLAEDAEKLRQELRSCNERLLDAQRHAASLSSQFSSKQQELQDKYDQLSQEHTQLRETSSGTHEKLVAANTQVTSLREQLEHVQAQIKKGVATAAADQVANLEFELRTTKLELQAAVAAQVELRENAQQYKVIASSNDNALSELSSASEKWKSEHESKLKKAYEELDELRQELMQSKESLKNMVTQVKEAEEQVIKAKVDSKTKLEEMGLTIKQLSSVTEKSDSREATLRSDIEKLKGAQASAQQNYERELQLHAAQVSAAEDMKERLDEKTKECREAQSRIAEINAKLLSIDNSHKSKEDSFQKTIASMETEQKELDEQNALLHSQIKTLTLQLKKIQDDKFVASTGDAAGDEATDAAAADSEAKTISELHSLLRYLRRENEINSEKLEIARQASSRSEAQVLQLQKTNDALRQQIQQQIKEAEDSARTSTEQAKLLEQIEQSTLLRESNTVLRSENERNLERCKKLQQDLAKMEEQMIPLRKAESLLKAEVETQKAELESMSETNKRWKDRVDQLVEKSQQVDPEEHKALLEKQAVLLKEKETLQKTVSDLEASSADLRKELEAKCSETEQKLDNMSRQYERMKGFAKNWKVKVETLTKQYVEKENALKATIAEKDKKIADLGTKSTEGEGSTMKEGTLTEAQAQARVDAAVSAESAKAAAMKDLQNKLMGALKTVRKENADLRSKLKGTIEVDTSSLPSSSPQTTPATTPVSSTPATAPSSSTEVKPVVTSTPAISAPPSIAVPAKANAASTSADTAAALGTPTKVEAKPRPGTPAPHFKVVPTKPAAKMPEAKPVVGKASALPPAVPKTEMTAEEKLRLTALKSMKQSKGIVKPKTETSATLATATATKPEADAGAEPEEKEKETAAEKPVSKLSATTPAFSMAATSSGFGSTGSFGSVGGFGSSTRPTFGTTSPASNLGKPAVFGASTFGATSSTPTFGSSAAPFGQSPNTSDNSETKSSPFLNLGQKAGSGTSNLVFGKPGITIPIPSSPAASPTTELPPALGVATEEQRRKERLARFASAKRTAPSPEEGTAPAKKVAKVGGAKAEEAPADAVDDAASSEAAETPVAEPKPESTE